MQVFLRHNLVFLAVPKAASTAIEAALRPHASIDVRSPPRERHVNAGRFNKTWAPFLKRSWSLQPETFAVLREPRARMESWYRYRLSEGRPKSTAGMTFEEFVLAALSESPPEVAQVGDQYRFVFGRDRGVLIDHLFAIEKPDILHSFLTARFGTGFAFDQRNVSPPADVTLSADTENLLFERRAAEFALYNRVLSSGHLRREDARGT